MLRSSEGIKSFSLVIRCPTPRETTKTASKAISAWKLLLSRALLPVSTRDAASTSILQLQPYISIFFFKLSATCGTNVDVYEQLAHALPSSSNVKAFCLPKIRLGNRPLTIFTINCTHLQISICNLKQSRNIRLNRMSHIPKFFKRDLCYKLFLKLFATLVPEMFM